MTQQIPDLSWGAVMCQDFSVVIHVVCHKLVSLVEQKVGQSALQRFLQPVDCTH